MKHKLFAILLLLPLLTVARSSKFLTKGVAPMYWMGYEQPYITDRALDEDRYKKNLDWVAANLAQDGFGMVCTDGWIEGAGGTVNANGYITKYNEGWQHDFAYWMQYAQDRNLTLGVYYNPLWISSSVASNGCKVKGRKDVLVSSLKGKDSFNGLIGWCDADKDGAEEYIRGYVRHFIDLGFKFLRIDFLCDYERLYGTERYKKALQWISSEAGDEIIVSLVMPNCYNEAQKEIPYGDMFRISADCFGGGWDFVSARRRGVRNGAWPQFENLFDGFVHFSSIPRSRIMMDGDFVRLGTCKREEEKQFWITLLVMAGSPIAIADQYNTIGDNLRYYQNERVNALVQEGFYARPLSTNLSDKEGSCVWYGKRKNGRYVAAFFNREEKPVTYTLNLQTTLSKNSALDIIDLWTGDSLGQRSKALSIELQPHECRMLEFTPSVKTVQDTPTDETPLYALGMAFGLWDSQESWKLTETEPGIYVWEGDMAYYKDNKQFKFALNREIWQRTYYLTPTEPICTVESGKEYEMTKCSELTGNLKDYFWGIPEGQDGHYRITVNLPQMKVRVDRVYPALYAVGGNFEMDYQYSHLLPRTERPNVFYYEGPLRYTTDNKLFRFALGQGDYNQLECLEPNINTTVQRIEDGEVYEMRRGSIQDRTARGTFWGLKSRAAEDYYRLDIDAEQLQLSVHRLNEVWISGPALGISNPAEALPMRKDANGTYTLEANLAYTSLDKHPFLLTTKWGENALPTPLDIPCWGMPNEAEGFYSIKLNAKTMELTLEPTEDALPELHECPRSTTLHDLTGRAVTRPVHGIYIRNGRKVLY